MTDWSHRYGPPQWPPPPPSESGASNALAIAALACGIGGVVLFFFPVPAVAAIPLGIIGSRRARDLGGSVMAAVGLALGVVMLVVFGAYFGLHFDEIRNSTSIWRVRVGTCLREVYPDQDAVRAPCSTKHGSEVIAIVRHPAPPGAAYPKGFQLNFDALAACRSPYVDYVGVPPEQSPSSTLYVQYPSEAQWGRGARTVICLAIGRNDAPLLGTMRGASPTAPG
jgi:hypothetical protein